MTKISQFFRRGHSKTDNGLDASKEKSKAFKDVCDCPASNLKQHDSVEDAGVKVMNFDSRQGSTSEFGTTSKEEKANLANDRENEAAERLRLSTERLLASFKELADDGLKAKDPSQREIAAKLKRELGEIDAKYPDLAQAMIDALGPKEAEVALNESD